jgi:hypothetical protein
MSAKKAKSKNRCWPGYEPVPGKPQHSQGSCRPKKKNLKSGEKKFRATREQQLSRWKTAHPGSPKKAAQHLHRPGAKRRTASRD